MAVFHVFLLVLVIGIVHHSHGRTYESESITINGTDTLPVKAPAPSNPQKNYDYFSLVLQWPKSFCNTGAVTCTSPIPNYFTVHGLWPQLYNGQWTNCNSDTKLNHDQRTKLNLMDFMKKYWPNLKSPGDNYRLWEHEYQKHGSCFSPFQEQPLLYFQKTVTMALQIRSVTNILYHSGGIWPSNREWYKLKAIEDAIFRHFNFIPRLRCNYAGGSGFVQLYEIEFCFERNGSLRDCNKAGDFTFSKCGNRQVQPDPLNPVVMFPYPL
ncbi:ribonuclease S-7-like [Fagus crenata]